MKLKLETAAAKIGRFFREHRIHSNFSLEAAANVIQIHADLLSTYESGQQAVPFETVFQLANLYDVAPDDVLAIFYDLAFGAQVRTEQIV